jgi:TPP-dependent pyruvate/acetoin dehydrogenase alpha subunit
LNLKKAWEKCFVSAKLLNKNKIKNLWGEIGKKIEESVEFANQSPFPDSQEIFEDVYVS